MANLYLNKKKDIDLYGLFEDVGAERFRKIAKACLRALFDEKQAKLARFLASEGVREDGLGLEDKEIGVLFRVSTTAEKDEYLRIVISSLAPGTVSTFIKTTMRQVLGPQILLKYFLLPGSSVYIEDIQPTSFIKMMVDDSSSSKKKKSPSKKKRSEHKKAQPAKNKKEAITEVSKENVQIPLMQESSNQVPSTSILSGNSIDTDYNKQFNQSEPQTDADTDTEIDVLSMLEAMMQ